MRRLQPLLTAAALLPLAARAHEGHGHDGAAHWHATDAWGFLLVVAIAAAIWFSRRK
jgi:hypothetical protein